VIQKEMNSIPLYGNLFSESIDKDLSPSQKASFMKKIIQIDIDGRNLIYMLIRVFRQENDMTPLSSVPYNGDLIEGGLTFDLDELPFKLKRMLYGFLAIHLNKMDEEAKMSKQRS